MKYLLRYIKPGYHRLHVLKNNFNVVTIKHYHVLGIETSCDDTGCAILSDSGKLLAEALHSQTLIHLRYGGINPYIAHELHKEKIESVVNEALKKASLNFNDIDAIAVTTKPGLQFSLQVGVGYGKFIARKYKKPLISIHHMEAHALVARMFHNISFPFLVLLISGGHCLLAIVKDVEEFLLLGQSLDNAPGEVMDKAARRMKLRNIPAFSSVSGGHAIELASKEAKKNCKFEFPLPLSRSRDCNFSFSGLKDSLVRKLVKQELEHGIIGDGIIPEVFDLCASFQLAITEHLVHRTERAMIFSERNNIFNNDKTLVVSGGVACNNFIFESLEKIGAKYGYKVCRPKPKVCTDNGIMIAWNGLEKLRKHNFNTSNINFEDIEPVSPLGLNIINDVKKSDLPVKVTRLKSLFEV